MPVERRWFAADCYAKFTTISFVIRSLNWIGIILIIFFRLRIVVGLLVVDILIVRIDVSVNSIDDLVIIIIIDLTGRKES